MLLTREIKQTQCGAFFLGHPVSILSFIVTSFTISYTFTSIQVFLALVMWPTMIFSHMPTEFWIRCGLKFTFTTLQFISYLNLCFFWNNIFLIPFISSFKPSIISRFFWLVVSRAMNFSFSSLCWTIKSAFNGALVLETLFASSIFLYIPVLVSSFILCFIITDQCNTWESFYSLEKSILQPHPSAWLYCELHI